MVPQIVNKSSKRENALRPRDRLHLAESAQHSGYTISGRLRRLGRARWWGKVYFMRASLQPKFSSRCERGMVVGEKKEDGTFDPSTATIVLPYHHHDVSKAACWRPRFRLYVFK
jgi:hypothetical protein